MKGHRLGDNLEAYPGGAVLVRDENVVVVADMHLGCEAALEYEGLSIPRLQTARTAAYMAELIDALEPDRVVVAGDLKHNFSRNLVQEWTSVSEFVSSLKDRALLEVVKGNHDNYLGLILREFDVPLKMEAQVGPVRILHGHAGRLDERPTVLGHIHPSIRLRDRVGAGVKDRCFLYDELRDILVLPALSIVASGTDVVRQESSDSVSPLLANGGLSGFKPLVFSGERALRFPTVAEMRKMEGV